MSVRIHTPRVLRGLHIVGIKLGNNYSTNNGMLQSLKIDLQNYYKFSHLIIKYIVYYSYKTFKAQNIESETDPSSFPPIQFPI